MLARRAAGLSTAFPAPHFPGELDPGVIAFDSGFAFPGVLPDLTAYAHAALTTHCEESLQYAPPQGHPDLRAWLAGYMNADGCNLTAQNILIVNGAKHGLELICRLLLDEGDTIVVTRPTYFTAIPIFRSFGVQFMEARHDHDGLDVEELERALSHLRAEGHKLPKFIYNVVDFHNPTGVAMSLRRRQALLDLSARYDVAIVEDNPYRRVRFEGTPLPTLKALDAAGHVLHVGTFSKLIAPGLRVGWIAAHPNLIARLMQLKSDGGSNPLIQRIVLDFCRSEAFTAHTHRVQNTYREHRDRMITALQRELPQAVIDVPEGGYYVWVTLPAGMNGDAVAREAARVGVNIIPGSKFFVQPGAAPWREQALPRDHIRLSYSFATVEQIDEGVRRLATVCRDQAAR